MDKELYFKLIYSQRYPFNQDFIIMLTLYGKIEHKFGRKSTNLKELQRYWYQKLLGWQRFPSKDTIWKKTRLIFSHTEGDFFFGRWTIADPLRCTLSPITEETAEETTFPHLLHYLWILPLQKSEVMQHLGQIQGKMFSKHSCPIESRFSPQWLRQSHNLIPTFVSW